MLVSPLGCSGGGGLKADRLPTKAHVQQVQQFTKQLNDLSSKLSVVMDPEYKIECQEMSKNLFDFSVRCDNLHVGMGSDFLA